MIVFKGIVYILIFSICTYIGILQSKKYSQRVDELKWFKEGLNIFKTKIKFTYEPVPDIFKEIGSNLKNNIGEIFLNSSQKMNILTAMDAWEQTIQETESLNLNKEDKNMMIKLREITR